jgi:hypothetical protein
VPARFSHLTPPPSPWQLLKDSFQFEDRGTVAVKGKGRMHAYFLLRQRTEGTSIPPPLVSTVTPPAAAVPAAAEAAHGDQTPGPDTDA